MTRLSVAVVGLGYFSRLHLAAWGVLDDVHLVGVTDLDPAKVSATAQAFSTTGYLDLATLLNENDPDIIDLVVPPPAQARLIRQALKPGRTIICQKPFCTSLAEASAIVSEAASVGAQVVIHENFRFQPWYRDIKRFLDAGQMGAVYQCRFALRPGDGRGADAYLGRQPAFRSMPRLLIHETGVHFIDLFRWLFGEIGGVYADLRQLNPVLVGEDAGTLMIDHRNGVRSVFDGNRLSDAVAQNPRLTMGEMTLEGEAGVLHLSGNGAVTFRPFSAQAAIALPSPAPFDSSEFGGGCVASLIRHVVAAVLAGAAPENTAAGYLAVIRACDAAYQSAATGHRITLTD